MATVTAPKTAKDMAIFNATAALELKLTETLKVHIAQAVRKMTDDWTPEEIVVGLSGQEAPQQVYDLLHKFGLRTPAAGVVYECIFFRFMLRKEVQSGSMVRLIIDNVTPSSVLQEGLTRSSRKTA